MSMVLIYVQLYICLTLYHGFKKDLYSYEV